MTGFQHSIPLGRPDISLDDQQCTACERAERGHLLSDAQRGVLRSASIFAKSQDAQRAQAALEIDRDRNARRGRK